MKGPTEENLNLCAQYIASYNKSLEEPEVNAIKYSYFFIAHITEHEFCSLQTLKHSILDESELHALTGNSFSSGREKNLYEESREIINHG